MLQKKTKFFGGIFRPISQVISHAISHVLKRDQMLVVRRIWDRICIEDIPDMSYRSFERILQIHAGDRARVRSHTWPHTCTNVIIRGFPRTGMVRNMPWGFISIAEMAQLTVTIVYGTSEVADGPADPESCPWWGRAPWKINTLYLEICKDLKQTFYIGVLSIKNGYTNPLKSERKSELFFRLWFSTRPGSRKKSKKNSLKMS